MIYAEKTYFNKFISIPLFFPIIYCVRELYLGFKNQNLITIFIFSIVVIFTFVVIITIIFSHLKISFFEEYFTYSLKPFLMKNKKIYYNEVNSFEVNKFDPLTDFNGWGVRKSKRYGTGYITDTDKIMTLDINGTLISFSIKNDTNVKEIMSKYVNKNIN